MFDQSYNRAHFLSFLHKRFAEFKQFSHSITIDNNDVESGAYLADVKTADDKNLAVFEFYIKPNTKLARNRVGLRNIVLHQIKQRVSDGALAVYIDQETQQWRLSFIAITPKFKGGKLVIEQTASKRYTFLLGKNTQTRTAEQRLYQLSKDSTLENITAAFAVEPLTKEFYQKLFEWYKRAQDQVTFPNDENSKDHTKTSLIRLLTRLLFIWFIKEKGLVNPELFKLVSIKKILHYDETSSYYKAILQNLFFATLNVEIKDRNFRTDKSFQGKNKDYGKQLCYRYHTLVKDETQWQQMFEKIPFLNGGLFECLDRDATKQEITSYQTDKAIRREKTMIRIEGFSDRADNPLKLPNQLFFHEDENSPGLITLFKQYQFTAAESTPTDISVALDPELLGKVFENLLSDYNPETKEQARKNTGSFYTPRAIVNYMVDESLKAYLSQAVHPADGGHALDRQRLDDLFNAADKTDLAKNIVNNKQIQSLIEAISRIKILDPAVGSGAFPMGLLQRLVALLAILDPKNERWKKEQLNIVENLTDSASKAKAIEDIEAIFSAENAHNNYGRKLYLIENCIYGVDIQIIAITIAKLRFFISLAIEQTPDDNKENHGITPLPNLETKLLVADSLISINRPENGQESIRDPAISAKEEALREVRHKNFSAKTSKTKTKYREQDKQLRQGIAELLEADGWGNENAQKIADWDPYDQNAQAHWFDPEWMFGITDGFDIVIGNPPYIQIQKFSGKAEQAAWEEQNYDSFAKTGDVYCLFYERGHQLLNPTGHLCYITSNKWMRAGYGAKTRAYFANKTNPIQLIDFAGHSVFETATVDVNILLLQKTKQAEINLSACTIDHNFTAQTDLAKYFHNSNNMLTQLSASNWIIADQATLALKAKIARLGTPLKAWNIQIYRGVLTGYNDAFIIDQAKRDQLISADANNAEIIKPLLRGKDIKRYRNNFAGKYLINAHNGVKKFKIKPINVKQDYPTIYEYLKNFLPAIKNRQDKGNHWSNLRNCAYYREFEKEKIIYSEIVQSSQFYYDTENFYPSNTAYLMTGEKLKYLLGCLNAKPIETIFRKFYVGGKLGGKGIRYLSNTLEKLPIPKPSPEQEQQMTQLVDEMIALHQAQNSANQLPQIAALDEKINQLVYQLYDLTPAEINIIEAT